MTATNSARADRVGATSDKVVAIVQARLGSARFPRKVLAEVNGRPLLSYLIDRLRRCASVTEIVLAIPDGADNDALEELGNAERIVVVRGSESDVLDRYYSAAMATNAGIVVRITGDCPLVDAGVVDRVVKTLQESDLEYSATGSSYPEGFDAEVMTLAALAEAWRESTEAYDREHVTPYLRRRADPARAFVELGEDFGACRVTLDEPADLQVIRNVLEHFGSATFDCADVAKLYRLEPQLFDANRHIQRNEGSIIGTGQKLWKRALHRIPGGGMLLSKQAQMHLPDRWPTYFSRAQGCQVWDLDGNEFLDVGFMGVGTNLLGYAHPKVDEAVRRVIDAGNMTTLNCPEEVELAERLCEIHPWADMARFTRSGGEACAVAVRIARAASGKDRVAFCGYHGWHDWYLAANLAEDDALDGHLLPGLEPLGVPRALRGTATPFPYNDSEALAALLSSGEVGVVFMEVERSEPPAPGFLQEVRRLATQHGAVLVFDECTSAFRRTLGGTHLVYDVAPDMAVFGKALGNGYAINAVIGRESVMRAANDTFISSTFWTERIGPSAALATLNVMAEEDAPRRVHEIGLQVREIWSDAAATLGLSLDIAGIPAISTFAIQGANPAEVKTFVTAELLANGMLASTAFYASIAHEFEQVSLYAEAIQKALRSMSVRLNQGVPLVDTPSAVASIGFTRLA